MTATTISAADITAEHASHTEFTIYCGCCRFNQTLAAAAQAGSDKHYSNIRLTVKNADDTLTATTFESHLAALETLNRDGYTETHWNWENRRYSGGRVNYGTQHYWVSMSFRNPVTGQTAGLSFNETREIR